jgi:rubrerythrin
MAANEAALSMLKTALEMEEKGYQFYEKAIAGCVNELGRKMFTMLRDDEIVHVERIKNIYGRLMGGEWSDEWKNVPTPSRDLGQVFRELAKKHAATVSECGGDLDAIRVGLVFEHKAVVFYREHLAQAQNPIERAFVKQMVAEEEIHHALLADMELYLTDTEGWFREREKGGLDGA